VNWDITAQVPNGYYPKLKDTNGNVMPGQPDNLLPGPGFKTQPTATQSPDNGSVTLN
jgi:hypothetical protein